MADDSRTKQEAIERLLDQGQGTPAAATPGKSAPAAGPASSAPQPPEGDLSDAMADARPTSTAAATGALEHDARLLAQEDIERLLGQSGNRPQPAGAKPASHSEGSPVSAEAAMASGDVEYLLSQAQQALASIDAPHEESPPEVAPFSLQEFAGAPPSTENATLDLIRDVELDVKIELGRTNMYLEDVLRLRKGSVISLDKLAGDPVDIFVNGRLVARGEVLVLNDNFCVRVAELIAGAAPLS